MKQEECLNKLNELASRTYQFNKDAEKALVEFVNAAGGIVITDCKIRGKHKDELIGFVYNDDSQNFEESYILAVMTYKDNLYIKVSLGDDYIEDIKSINIEDYDDDSIYLVSGGLVLMNATYHNLCEVLPEYVEK